MASTQPVSPNRGRINSTLRQFLDNEASGGILLMAVAVLAILTANSPVAGSYFSALHAYIGPLSVQHWINDALMALFFLLVGLEIKREMLDGQLSSWSRRLLPGAAAAGGMAFPALIYIAFNLGDPAALRGWAIPSATDIAFALGVLSLLGPKVPASLKIFLAALAIIDDLGAVIVIALFYTTDLNFVALGGAALVISALILLNRLGVMRLWLYLVLGAVLWVLVLRSGVHATLAGVILALTIPIRLTPGTPEASPSVSPLHQLEHALQKPVAFLIVPIFGFANAGVSFTGVTPAVLIEPLTLGVAAGLVVGKLVGVFGTVAALVRLGLADLPAAASWGQTLGVALLCGIGFTMSLFIGLLAFDDPAMQDRVKFGILAGSLIAGLAGYAVLRVSDRRKAASTIVL
ncbi:MULTISPECIES: Na+/H+ antiporter NhaA [unclassified Shinella]|jgi:NhaA family Na+:H+ antiporter|uniref:Na+/H+ antiporter NhaA n=1 Tax=unclassified Shinella TaxID=2643062 RepID=UPI00225D7055|nr:MULTISPECIES: Na+/H+ antiporter NhaA [unclassified Shinella]MCO5140542.1 Na+/H+ antiporter NhaA [Shinella sp.]MDC7254736.1 Na+/H+ antiporter NhaA [Shinella sp. YE25]CAI0337469.1 Na(+):H(+) antiporter NhaA [Rhizobiaceae bacterium]CAK7255958.1 Na(+):H(+) antiporter NhaA [Shinella sp. WSC3-e]